MKGRQRLIGLGVASAGGALAHAVHMPLAWVLGSMLGVGLWSLWRNHTLPQPSSWRRTAQGVIGVGLGLYFTPEVLGQLGTLAPWVLVGALTALALSVLAGAVLHRWTEQKNPGWRQWLFWVAVFMASAGLAVGWADAAELGEDASG